MTVLRSLRGLSQSLGYLDELLREADAGPDDHVIFGSAVAHIRGFRMPRPCGDVDVFVTRPVWGRLLALGELLPAGEVCTPRAGDPPLLEFALAVATEQPDGPPIHVFYDWSSRDAWLSVDECFALAESWGGWRLIPIKLLIEHKRNAAATNRSLAAQKKHLEDVAALA